MRNVIWSQAKRREASDRSFARGNADVIEHPASHSRLRRLRVDRGLTQAAVAAAAGLHVTNFARIENGQARPRKLTQERIARALETEAVLLFGSEWQIAAYQREQDEAALADQRAKQGRYLA
jgi:transcriptional regulator with XRE-family HTH domain